MEQYAWYQHYSYLLNKEDIFEILFPGRDKTNRGEGLHNDVIIITSKKGAGKTSLAKMLMYIFSQHKPNDKFVVFCGIPDLYSDMKEVIGEKRSSLQLGGVLRQIRPKIRIPSKKSHFLHLLTCRF
jgi:hypothetical protein